MIKHIINTEISLIKNVIFSSIAVLFFISCVENGDGETFYYVKYNDKNRIIGYEKRVVYVDKHKRIDSIFRYDNSKKMYDIEYEFYNVISKTKLISDDKTIFLTISKKDSCYNNSASNVSLKTCFNGISSLEINNQYFDRTYEFIVQDIGLDGVTNRLIFDKTFILLRQEYVDGFLHYYRIDRVDYVDGI